MEHLKTTRVHGGELRRYKHASPSTGCLMTFSVFIPPAALEVTLPTTTFKAPVLYFLSGLTCTDLNFCEKAGAFSYAAEARIALVVPDTSPRGVEGIPGSDETSWDFGVAASFYLDATQLPWARNFKMESYIMKDLPAALASEPSLSSLLNLSSASISGHSMGGYGALTLSLRHPASFRSVSAFAPIAHPSKSPWGVKAFSGYLGKEESAWSAHDPTAIIATKEGALAAKSLHIKVDVGGADEWGMKGFLLENDFLAAAQTSAVPILFQRHEGYDHSYYFVSSFIASHIKHHSQFLHATE